MWVCSCFHSGSENISVPSSAMPTWNEAAAWALGWWERLFEPAESAAGTPMAAPNASEQAQSISAAARARRRRGVVMRRVVSTAIETAYTPQSCVSLRPAWDLAGVHPHTPARDHASVFPRREAGAARRTARIGWAAMRNGRWRYWGPLGVVLAVAFALRLWGIKQGLPYVYDVDEYGHFVPEAVAYVRPWAEPALLRQSARVDLPAARRSSVSGSASLGSAPVPRSRANSRCTPIACSCWRGSRSRCSERSRCGCSTSSARACSIAPSACSRAR